jgi:ketosteroid isomerase-like protein
LDEVIDAGDHVVVIAQRRARNDVTGLQISDMIAQVFSFDDDDKCVRVQEFYDRAAALKAAGVEQA